MQCCGAGQSCCAGLCCTNAAQCCAGQCCPNQTQCCAGQCCGDECFYEKWCVNTLGLNATTFTIVLAVAAAIILVLLIIAIYFCFCAGTSRRRSRHKSDYEMGSLHSQPPRTVVVAVPASSTVTNPSGSVVIHQSTSAPLIAPAATTTSASVTRAPELTEEAKFALIKALQNVQRAIAVALAGIATDKLTVDEGVTLIAVAATNALMQTPCNSQAEFERNAVIVFNFIDGMFREHLPSMPQETRENFVRIILQRMGDLARQAKKSRLEDSLETIKQSLIISWHGFMTNKLSLDEAEMLMGVAVAAALRNCVISTTEELKAHLAGFNSWMMIVADECAPNVSREVKEQIISHVWSHVASLF